MISQLNWPVNQSVPRPIRGTYRCRKTSSFGISRRAVLVITDVSEELITSIIREERISEIDCS
jgi:hypothetical protein